MPGLPSTLRHSSQDEPGFTRRRRGKGFSYHDVSGNLVQSKTQLARIKALGLPPAYEDVWICRHANGHLQAVGTDARGRKQYRYHAEWRAYQDRLKFDALEDFGRALPGLRTQVAADLRRNRPDRVMVSAALIRLIDLAGLRIGSDRYAKLNGSYGASTLLSRHLKLYGTQLKLSFRAKGGRRVRKQLKDRTLARVLGRIDDMPGQRVFTCIGDDGDSYPVLSEDVNAYMAATTKDDRFSAKTFRTWQGTLYALNDAYGEKSNLTIKRMSEAAAERLHNTPSIARSSYIHPSVIDLAKLKETQRDARLDNIDLRRAPNGLPTDEKRLISFLAAQRGAQ